MLKILSIYPKAWRYNLSTTHHKVLQVQMQVLVAGTKDLQKPEDIKI
jgi:hypothetical protein